MNSWTGFKELILVDKVIECDTIMSFYFKAKDGGKLKVHKAGQFLAFRIPTTDEKYKDVVRAYSISNLPNDEMYRISVKKIEGGLISSYLFDELQIGDCIEALVPQGEFMVKDTPKDEPIVLLSGGIGVTPVLAMLYDEMNTRTNIHFVQAVHNSKIQPFKSDIENITNLKGFSNTVFYSSPLETDVKGIHYHEQGYITKEWLKDHVPLNGQFYFCGPPVFMKGIETALLELGVSKECINYENF